ncbi:hypothetical protein [Butyrivibrio sp. AE3004]|uniref:hypothetical protein n=1 Tax=Butyrivibrio sp. AE3004 TaxID=1506994 RepID=UPI000493BA1D|nr:hypothetical protein [Butyrivibrio sp. AE3004]
MESILIILISAAVFFSIALWLAVDSEHMAKWTQIAFFIAIIGGLGIYGIINASIYSAEPLSAVLRTVVDLGKMFGNTGGDNYEKFTRAVGSSHLISLFYWLIHFFAYYSLVSAVIMLIGDGVLRKLRTFFLMIHDIEIIYGINEHTIAIGRELVKNGKVSVVYVGKGAGYEATIRNMGGIWFSDNSAKKPSKKFLQRISLKRYKGKIRVSALSENEDSNFDYASKMMNSLQEFGIDPVQTELVLLGREDIENNYFQALGNNYGYGSVFAFNGPELTARILLKKYPVCNTIPFDSEGKAERNVDTLIIGFGRVGQELLRRMVASGQFEGSEFRACVFDPAADKKDGFYRVRYEAMLENYDISLKSYDGRSVELTEYVKENASTLTGIYIAVGNETAGREMAYGITEILAKAGYQVPIYQCCDGSVIFYKDDLHCEITDTFDAEIIYGRNIDEMAKMINHYYRGDNESAEEQWKDCSYFDRMSCRASADYLSCLMERLGISGAGEIGAECMENLAKSEHKRWCAFHYSMGYRCMTQEELKEREEMYKKDHSTRITKDPKNRIHACLIPWDELDTLSEYENSITGKNLDYKQMDRDNIETTIKLLWSNDDSDI